MKTSRWPFFLLSLCSLTMLILVSILNSNESHFKHNQFTAPKISHYQPNVTRAADDQLVIHYSSQTEILTEEFPWSKKVIILFWTPFFGSPYSAPATPECNCILTTNRSLADKADGFVIHARDFQLPPTKYKTKPWILFSRENPVYTPVLKNEKLLSQFNLSTTYRLDSDIPNPSMTRPTLDPPIPFKNKTGLIMVASSNCETVRTEYQRLLMQYIQVDSYGSCLHNKNNLVQIYGKDFTEKKQELERNYKFSLVFSNQDCDYFVDARMSHSLSAGTVPVWMGTNKVDEFLPGNLKHAIIKVKDFESPQKLAEYLLYLSKNETAYNKYLEWKEKGHGDCSSTQAICHFWSLDRSDGKVINEWCDVCKKVYEGKFHNGLKVDNCQARSHSEWIRPIKNTSK